LELQIGGSLPTNSKPVGPMMMIAQSETKEQQLSDHIYYSLLPHHVQQLSVAFTSSHNVFGSSQPFSCPKLGSAKTLLPEFSLRISYIN
jgi:hypothetical protein